MTRRAIICGGSIAGLFAAVALRQAGWEVAVYERSPEGLSGRGAGIVTHRALVQALERLGAETSELGVQVQSRIAIGQNGERLATLAHPQTVTSWDRIHSILRALIPDESYHLGYQCTGYRQGEGAATAVFSDGSEATADLIVGADGFRSAVRGQMWPDVLPQYSGYVVWRTLAPQDALMKTRAADVFAHFAFYLPAGTQALGYPIAGEDNELTDGQLRYNLVWYVPVDDRELKHMLTDATGHHHPVSIPPPLITDQVLAQMQARARQELPQAFVDVFQTGPRPFFAPIYDHHSPTMAEGRVALVGDAACSARPHVGMGVTKAAEDALELARQLGSGSIDTGLRAFSEVRVAAVREAFDNGRKLGGWITEADPDNPDGTANKRLEQVMKETASRID